MKTNPLKSKKSVLWPWFASLKPTFFNCSIAMCMWANTTYGINSSPPSATCMWQWIASALVQIMACRLFGAKPSFGWIIVNWTLRNQLKCNFNQNTELLIHENAFENIVFEMAAILLRGRWVIPLVTIPVCFMQWEYHDTIYINTSL